MAVFQDDELKEAWASILGKEKYVLMLREIADSYPDKRSVFIDYDDIDMYSSQFAMYVMEAPDRCIAAASEYIKESAMPPSWDPVNIVNVRITSIPHDAKVGIRKLRAKHLGRLVSVDGIVKRVTPVRPRMTKALFRCAKCGQEIWVDQPGMILAEPAMCTNPATTCNRGPLKFILDEQESIYRDTQRIDFQESPEDLRGGDQPERMSGYLEDDIAGEVTPGSRVTFNGILRSAEKQDRNKTTTFETYLDVISVEYEQHEYDEIVITDEDEKAILEMSRDPHLFENIIDSISPTIYGMREGKAAVALQLFGGCHKVMDDGSAIRGDMHILIVGDPGVAKSQILRYMSQLSPRGIYASGKSASAAGLTATAVKDEDTGGWVLEAGALVLADGGLACIDELDKMTEQDRSSLHEAMESQRISVAKAGLTMALQCRCSMLAAANPKLGRFDTEGSAIATQIDLPAPLLSRFDLIFVMNDVPEPKYDRKVTQYILKVHRRGEARQYSGSESPEGVDIDQIMEETVDIKPKYSIEQLRKYVAYAKQHIVPVMTDSAAKMIEDNYVRIRSGYSESKTVPITARQLEAYVRIAEASAKMRLSNTVTDVDAQRAIDLVAYYMDKIARTQGGILDIDRMSEFSSKDRADINQIEKIIKDAGENGITTEDIISAASHDGIKAAEVNQTLEKLSRRGVIYSPKSGHYRHAG